MVRAERIPASRVITGLEFIPIKKLRTSGLQTNQPLSFGIYQIKSIENNLSKEAAWEEYNKPIDGLTLYIPSRFAEPVPSISKKRKSMKRVCKDDETQVPTGKDEEDDSLTIAQVTRLRKKNEAMCSSDENPPKVQPLIEVLQKMGKEFPEKFKRSRYLRTPTNVRPKIADSGGSASRELTLNELLQKEEVVKRKREHLGDKRAREDDEDESCMDCYEDREKGVRLEADNKDSWMSQKIAHEDETVAPLKIHQESEEEETGNKAGKDMVVSSANGNNSSDLPLSANGRVVDLVVPRPKTRQKCDNEVDVNGIKAEKKKTIVGDGTKEAKCLLQEVGENHSNEKEDVDESLKQRDLAIDEISLNLEARMMKVEKTLAKIREWKTIGKNQTKNGTTA
ncbi:hypothetical protein Bca4012_063890 [Brassica carinata]|uniref:Uncharacterized protein n=1 Tax=Brassica carinata TaxID=52824 RepID=A0A8X7V7H8_BRACI|nr:hypothetical protein Bca52824_033618 [Brassica carinata]